MKLDKCLAIMCGSAFSTDYLCKISLIIRNAMLYIVHGVARQPLGPLGTDRAMRRTKLTLEPVKCAPPSAPNAADLALKPSTLTSLMPFKLKKKIWLAIFFSFGFSLGISETLIGGQCQKT